MVENKGVIGTPIWFSRTQADTVLENKSKIRYYFHGRTLVSVIRMLYFILYENLIFVPDQMIIHLT